MLAFKGYKLKCHYTKKGDSRKFQKEAFYRSGRSNGRLSPWRKDISECNTLKCLSSKVITYPYFDFCTGNPYFTSTSGGIEKVQTKMEWLRPHMARIDEFCATLKPKNSTTYLHIPRAMTSQPHCTCGIPDCSVNTETGNCDYQRQDYDTGRTYSEVYRTMRKTQPVSVIVSDNSRLSSTSDSSNSIVPSPSSSISGDNKSNSGDNLEDSNHMESLSPDAKKMKYTYKPQPMVRKSKRQFISDDKKDDTYWQRRKRNNEAAKKSREQRREKEIEVSKKCQNLENDNTSLRMTIVNLQERNVQLEKTMQIYKDILIKNNLL